MEGNRDLEQRLEECFSTLQQLTRSLAQFTSTSSPSARPQATSSAPASSFVQPPTYAQVLPHTSSQSSTLVTRLSSTSAPVLSLAHTPTQPPTSTPVWSLPHTSVQRPTSTLVFSLAQASAVCTGQSNVAPTVGGSSSSELY